MTQRNEYQLSIVINSRKLTRVIIDQHYRIKHSDSIDDQTILELVKKLDGDILPIDKE